MSGGNRIYRRRFGVLSRPRRRELGSRRPTIHTKLLVKTFSNTWPSLGRSGSRPLTAGSCAGRLRLKGPAKVEKPQLLPPSASHHRLPAARFRLCSSTAEHTGRSGGGLAAARRVASSGAPAPGVPTTERAPPLPTRTGGVGARSRPPVSICFTPLPGGRWMGPLLGPPRGTEPAGSRPRRGSPPWPRARRGNRGVGVCAAFGASRTGEGLAAPLEAGGAAAASTPAPVAVAGATRSAVAFTARTGGEGATRLGSDAGQASSAFAGRARASPPTGRDFERLPGLPCWTRHRGTTACAPPLPPPTTGLTCPYDTTRRPADAAAVPNSR